MTTFRYALLAAFLGLGAAFSAAGQGIHFSQFYNMPMLASPANTGLMTEDDYRVNVQYRNQFGAVPVPFNTFAVAADGQALRKTNRTNWLGLGAVILNDRAGEGGMSVTRVQFNGAYHLSLGKRQMLSAGIGVGGVNRRVNMSQLVFDAQWEGYQFNPAAPNLEPNQSGRAGYLDLSTGVNYTYFPNKYMYVKGSVGVDHINRPVESVFKGGNVIEPRTHFMADAGIVTDNGTVLNPTIYFTAQQKAWEAVIGGNVSIPLFDSKDSENLLVGVYHRVRDAIVIMAGYEYRMLRFQASYDYTVSGLGQYIKHNGAFEIGIGYHGMYRRKGAAKNMEGPSSAEIAPGRVRLR